ncbi:hypothetical protein ACFPRL_20295 [Pseudoclavibacter helvolus]
MHRRLSKRSADEDVWPGSPSVLLPQSPLQASGKRGFGVRRHADDVLVRVLSAAAVHDNLSAEPQLGGRPVAGAQNGLRFALRIPERYARGHLREDTVEPRR